MRLYLKIIGFVFFVFLFACKCKKLEYDYSQIYLDEWYKGTLKTGEDAYFIFEKADSILSGNFFIDKGRAIVDVYSFMGIHKKSHVAFSFSENPYVQNAKGKLITIGDTINFSLNYKKKNQNIISLVKGKKQIKKRIKQRYNSIAFSKVRTQEVVYGKAKGYYSSKPIDSIEEDQYASIILDVGKDLVKSVLMRELPLDMDIYQPIGDTIQKRPLLILVHGGAFIIGDKSTKTMVEISTHFAKRGYVVASINYRLGYMFLPGGYAYLERCIYRAIQDTRAAIRYLVYHADNYRIDPDLIFLAGNSAGGFTALKTTFMEEHEIYESSKGNRFYLREDLGCLDCSGNDYRVPFSIKAVVNMWGALTDTSLIESHENIPILLFHGDKDNVVPPNHQYPFENVGTEFSSFFSHKTFGSASIYEHVKKKGFMSKLILFKGYGHDPQIEKGNKFNDNLKTILNEMESFFYEIMDIDSCSLIGKEKFTKIDYHGKYQLSGNEQIMAQWNIEGGKIIEYNNNNREVRVVWFSNAKNHTINCKSINKNHFVKEISKQITLE